MFDRLPNSIDLVRLTALQLHFEAKQRHRDMLAVRGGS